MNIKKWERKEERKKMNQYFKCLGWPLQHYQMTENLIEGECTDLKKRHIILIQIWNIFQWNYTNFKALKKRHYFKWKMFSNLKKNWTTSNETKKSEKKVWKKIFTICFWWPKWVEKNVEQKNLTNSLFKSQKFLIFIVQECLFYRNFVVEKKKTQKKFFLFIFQFFNEKCILKIHFAHMTICLCYWCDCLF